MQVLLIVFVVLLAVVQGMHLPSRSNLLQPATNFRQLATTFSPLSIQVDEKSKDDKDSENQQLNQRGTVDSSTRLIAFFGLLDNDNPLQNIQSLVKKVITIFQNGFYQFYLNYQKVSKLKKLLKLNQNLKNPQDRQTRGEILSYSDYKLLEIYEQDFQKAIRIIIFLPFAFEFFIYTSVLIPILTMNNNLWAFVSQFPSTFDTSEDRYKRENLLYQRRLSSFYNIVLTQYKEISENQYYPAQLNHVKKMKENIHLIQNALIQYLQQDNLMKAIHTLQPLYTIKNSSNGKNNVNKGKNQTKGKATVGKGKKTVLNTSGLSPAVVKECCRAIGRDGVPNIPIIRNLNRKELGGFIDALRNSDEFLFEHGLQGLNDVELRAACLER